MSCVLERLRGELAELAERHDLLGERVEITAGPLSPEEAIGRTGSVSLSLATGHERLIEARFRGARGQAFTNRPAAQLSTVGEALALDLDDDASRACFLASANAVCRCLLSDIRTVHCKNNEPERCGRELAQELKCRFGWARLGVVGFNPAIVRGVSEVFGPERVGVVDPNPDRVETTVAGVGIRDGRRTTEFLIGAVDVVLAAGTTFVSGSADAIIDLADRNLKPLVFYGVTCAAVTRLLGFERICPCAS